MQITRVNPFDDKAVAAWHAALTSSAADGREDPPLWTLAEMTVTLRDDSPSRGYALEAFAANDGEAVVGVATLEYPLQDNPTLADVEVNVPPEHRGRGIGDAVFAAVVDRADELGRTKLTATVNQPIGAATVPGVAFAAKHGFTSRNVMVRRILDLPVPAEKLAALTTEAEDRMGGYRLESWHGPCPAEFVDQYANLRSLILVEAPTGDMELEPMVWDVARLRAEEEMLAKQDRSLLTTVAVASDGSLAGHTQIVVPAHDPKTYQWDTLVLSKHRGHRLGLGLKAANLHILCDLISGPAKNLTWNAEQNGHMNAVNARLGFRAVEHTQEWQRS